jgi:small conductance mechanosensitive channel
MEQINQWLKEVDTEIFIQYAIDYSVNLIGALLVFLIGKLIAKGIVKFVRNLMGKSELDPIIVSFLSNILYAILFTLVVIAAISTLGVETTSLAAVIAAAGLAIGLSLQNSLSNFASGILVIVFRPFKVGDYIEAGGTAGVVEEVNVFTSHLKTPDNCAVVVPNAQITGGVIKNYSAKKQRRIDLVIGVGYEDDLKKTKSVLEEILSNHEKVLSKPEPLVALSELADSSVNFVVRPWVKTDDYWDVRFDLMMAIKERLDAENISIPYPQSDVHVVSDIKAKPAPKKAATKKKAA